MAGNCTKRRKWKERRHAKNPHCHWCGVVTILLPPVRKRKHMPLNLATLDHIRSRLDPQRRKHDNDEIRWVLACWQCNNERSHIECAALPIEEQRERSGRHGDIKEKQP